MEKLSEKFTNLLLRYKVIEEKDWEIYSYGFQITLANIINVFIALTLGLIIGRMPEVVIFFIVFYFARQYAGGYHASTYTKCFFSFACCILFMLILSSLLLNIGNPWWVLVLSYLLYGVAVWRISPCPSEQVALTESEQKTYRKISWGILLAAGCANALLAGFHIDTYSCVITTTVWEVTFLMWLGRRAYERREKNVSGEGGC